MIDAIQGATTGAGDNYASAGGVATEALSNVRTVTALNAQPDIITRYRIYLLEAMQIGITKGRKVGLGNGGLFCAAFLTYAWLLVRRQVVADAETRVTSISLVAPCCPCSSA